MPPSPCTVSKIMAQVLSVMHSFTLSKSFISANLIFPIMGSNASLYFGERVAASSLTSGDHGTTYGGNPLAAAAIVKVLELYEKEHILDRVKETAP